MTGGQFVPAITYSTSGQFTKNKERIQEFMKTADTCYIIGTIWLMPATKTWSKEQNEDVKFTPGPPTKREPVGHGCPPTPPSHLLYFF